jgi:hypothetical protein
MARLLPKLGQQPGHDVLEGPTKAVFAGKKHGQASSQ